MPPMINPSDDLSPEEAQMLAEALRQMNDQLRKLLDKLTKGELLSQEELERLAKMVGLTQMDNLHYREWMVQRMKKALHFKEPFDRMLVAQASVEKMAIVTADPAFRRYDVRVIW